MVTIFDHTMLISKPVVLALENSGDFVLLEDTFCRLSSSHRCLLQISLHNGLVQALPLSALSFGVSDLKSSISQEGCELIRLALDLRERGKKVRIASLDQGVVAAAYSLGFVVWRLSDVRRAVKPGQRYGVLNEPVFLAVQAFKRSERFKLVLSFLLSGLVVACFSLLFVCLDFLAPEQLFLIHGLLGVFILFLFYLRARMRMSYGFFQVLIALVGIVAVPNNFVDTNGVTGHLDVALKLFGCIYIALRGMRNLSIAFRRSSFKWVLKSILKKLKMW